MKLWSEKSQNSAAVEDFTIGKDAELDLVLAEFDILGTLAHVQMLSAVGLLSTEDFAQLKTKLRQYYQEARHGKFKIEEGVEDIHSQVELKLTRELGDIGKKIHTARSRNDQVLVDIRLFFREEIRGLWMSTSDLFHTLLKQGENFSEILMPGYTHMQVAMVSSFGLWLGAYAESLIDDLNLLGSVFKIINQNPLGSGAGYGSSMPIDRELTTKLLGFDELCINSIYSQMGRGKSEWYMAIAVAGLAATISKLAMDICLYSGQNFGFLSFPEEFTTGSSIMPHKRNPDVFELIRARCNQLQSLPSQINSITSNLPSGYHRDFQQLKEIMIPALRLLNSCINMMNSGVTEMIVNKECIDDARYDYLFTVEEVNALVKRGIPFREAYQTVSNSVKAGTFRPNRNIDHTHIGSIGNPGFHLIGKKWDGLRHTLDFSTVDQAISKLWK